MMITEGGWIVVNPQKITKEEAIKLVKKAKGLDWFKTSKKKGSNK
jgi:hypothetical protein